MLSSIINRWDRPVAKPSKPFSSQFRDTLRRSLRSFRFPRIRGGAPGETVAGRRVLAVASGGGHWVQLQRLRPALGLHDDVAFVTTHSGYEKQVAGHRLHLVNDASRDKKLGLLVLMLRLLVIMLKERPRVVISTGAAPGYFALRIGRLLGARTIWVDSIANVDEMSLAGRLARRHADLWLTQWPHLATPGGPQFAGAVL